MSLDSGEEHTQGENEDGSTLVGNDTASLKEAQESGKSQSAGCTIPMELPATPANARTRAKANVKTLRSRAMNTPVLEAGTDAVGGSSGMQDGGGAGVRDKFWVLLAKAILKQKVSGSVWNEILDIWAVLQREWDEDEVRRILQLEFPRTCKAHKRSSLAKANSTAACGRPLSLGGQDLLAT